jgi:FAD/FMN-containing dehydrogenase
MPSQKDALAGIVGGANVLDDPRTLEAFSKDESLTHPLRPWFVVRPGSAAEVQKLVKWANETATPLVPVSSGPPHFLGDTVPSAPEAVVVDLGRMKGILRIDRRNRVAVIEPGVTYAELDAALAQQGLRVARPLLPRANKSVIASLLERQPTCIPRLNFQLTDPLRNCGVVWGTGEIAFTGEAGLGPLSLEKQWQAGRAQLDSRGPMCTDLMRLVSGAQGSMGIVIWASIRLELLPAVHRYAFVPADRFEDLVDFSHRLERTRLGEEVAVFNAAQLARLVAANAEEAVTLAEALPEWCAVIGVAGAALFPEERVRVQEKDLAALVQQCRLAQLSGLPGVPVSRVANAFEGCCQAPHWKLREKGGALEILFLSTLEKVTGFVETVRTVAQAHGYPAERIGVYVQAQHQGVSHHVEFTLPYDPSDPDQLAQVRGLHAQASHALIAQGAYFSRPYGAWADMVYSRDAAARSLLRTVKQILDPRNVLNPGKLCF